MSTPASATHARESRTRRAAATPETIRQAQNWEAVKQQVLRVGLCHKCAAQYAWGVQIGFTLSHPPCEVCVPVVAEHGTRDRPNGWRTLHKVNTGGWRDAP